MSLSDEHNTEAQAVWDAFNAGRPIRPPVALGTATQFFIYNDAVNPGAAVDWERYCTDADIMLDFQLRAAVWRAEHIAPYCDDPIGMPPNREAWLVRRSVRAAGGEQPGPEHPCRRSGGHVRNGAGVEGVS